MSPPASADVPTPAPEPTGRRARWATAPGRALILPLAAMVAVVLIVAMSMVWPVDGQVVIAAVVGILTLAAALAGHAAGLAAGRDREPPQR